MEATTFTKPISDLGMIQIPSEILEKCKLKSKNHLSVYIDETTKEINLIKSDEKTENTITIDNFCRVIISYDILNKCGLQSKSLINFYADEISEKIHLKSVI